jgi:hypothetical protein
MDPEFRRASTGRNMPAVEQTIIDYVSGDRMTRRLFASLQTSPQPKAVC